MMYYQLPTEVNVGGVEHAIRSDYRVALDIISMLSDDELTREEKAAAAIEMFYEEQPDDISAALEECFKFIDMGTSSKRKSPRLLDWERDFAYIVAPINRVLGREIRTCDYLHWWTFMGAYIEIGGDCLLANIISLRDKIASGKRLEKYEREWLRKNRELVILPQKYTAEDDDFVRYWGGEKSER